MKLPRSFFMDEMWKERRVYSRAEAWLDVVNMRAHDRTEVMIGGCRQEVGEDECAVSVRWLAMRWQWSEKAVRTFVKYLTERGMIETRRGVNATIIRVMDWGTPKGTPKGTPNADDYQDVTQTEGTPKGTPKGEQELDIYNNINIYNPTTARACNNISIYSNNIDGEIEVMKGNQSWVELVCMTHHLRVDELSGYLDRFGVECKMGGKMMHDSMDDAYMHFRNWLRIELQRNKGNGRDKRYSQAECIEDAERRAISRTLAIIREAKRRRGEV